MIEALAQSVVSGLPRGVASARETTGAGRLLASVFAVGRGLRRWIGLSITTREADMERAEDLAAAQAEALLWQRRAAALEAHISDLDDRLAQSERITMDLRSRLVCLHGKLATTAATARYQRFITALENRPTES